MMTAVSIALYAVSVFFAMILGFMIARIQDPPTKGETKSGCTTILLILFFFFIAVLVQIFGN
jgi:hypothetical protein